jgi:hypothetical protein
MVSEAGVLSRDGFIVQGDVVSWIATDHYFVLGKLVEPDSIASLQRNLRSFLQPRHLGLSFQVAPQDQQGGCQESIQAGSQ